MPHGGFRFLIGTHKLYQGVSFDVEVCRRRIDDDKKGFYIYIFVACIRIFTKLPDRTIRFDTGDVVIYVSHKISFRLG